MKQMEIDSLINCCVDYFDGAHYTVNRIGKYRSLWRNGIVRYMSERSISVYSPEIGSQYIDEQVSRKDMKHEEREKIRSIQVLDDYLNLGYVRLNTQKHVEHVLDGPVGQEMQKLINHLRNLRRTEKTIADYKLYLSCFLKHLKSNHVDNMNEISENHIIKFISTRENNKVNIVSALRVLFRYWFDNHVIAEDMEALLRNYKWTRKERVPSYYTPEEVAKIEKSVDRSGRSGKRTYAMLLLATRLGLRGSDIAGLTYGNINWKESKITLVQYKTKEPIELPLLAEVGNAIIDYLRNGRPESSSDHVFLSSRAPYVEATRTMVSGIINDVISKAGVSVKYRHHGPHSMRHSLASTMLRNGVSFPVISETLGHKYTTSTMKYLRIDVTSLQKCALPVPPVGEGFYQQKGGAFYE